MYVRIYHKTQNGKTYKTAYLAESKRQGKKTTVIHLLNISHLPPEQIDAMDNALKAAREGKSLCEIDTSNIENMPVSNSRPFGAFYVFHEIAKQIGLDRYLGKELAGMFFLLMVIARVIHPASKRATATWGKRVPLYEIMGLDAEFTEDSLYEAMDEIVLKQDEIEEALFEQIREKADGSDLFLYDVTSTYFEGTKNELSAFGYNRDGKKGKMQIVIGLLTASDGTPVSTQIFKGNTTDPKTFVEQVEKLSKRFKVKRVTVVGDKGMIKSAQIEELGLQNFHYITSITKAQIKALINDGEFNMQLFDDKLMEVKVDEVRYIMKRNKNVAKACSESRKERIEEVKKFAETKNAYLTKHKKAKKEVALSKVNEKAEKLNVFNLLKIHVDDGIKVDEITSEIEKAMMLDGCYCLKTDLITTEVDKEIIHKRYKSLSQVEQDFRKMKTTHLEVRPVYHIKGDRTKAHVFMVMLALRLLNEFLKKVGDMDESVDELISALNEVVCIDEVIADVKVTRVVRPVGLAEKVLNKIGIKLPDVLKAVCANGS
jgi:transposase